MRLLRGRPACKAVIATSEHSDSSIAPGLPNDPIDDLTRIGAVVFIRNGLIGAESLSTRETYNSNVSRCRRALGVVGDRVRSVDSKCEGSRQASGGPPWP